MYLELPPPADLAALLECVWTHRLPERSRPGAILPDGRTDIIWSDTGQLLFAGPQARSMPNPLTPGALVAGARFRVGCGPRALDVPADALVERHVDLAALDTHAVRRIVGTCAGTEAVGTGPLADALRRAKLDQRRDRLVSASVAQLARGRPAREIADGAGLSERQLLRRFRHDVGYGPRTLRRVLRLQATLPLLRAAAPYTGDLAGVAHDAGYADQAHLARQCVDLTGMTPTQLTRRLRA